MLEFEGVARVLVPVAGGWVTWVPQGGIGFGIACVPFEPVIVDGFRVGGAR